MTNVLFLASLVKKNSKNANKREQCNNSSNPVATGIKSVYDPIVNVKEIANRMIDINNIIVKQNLFRSDLTLSNPKSTTDKRISGFA